MQRVTITLDDDLMAAVDAFILSRGYANRSEAIRDLARAGLDQAAEAGSEGGASVGALVYVYDHESRELPRRLTNTFHEHHNLVLATLHVHLDHEHCMEVAALRGRTDQVRHFAEHVMAERGVKHGRLMLVPGQLAQERHAHGDEAAHAHSHIHVQNR
ncbi:MAG: nickel-responsive transcriptional regulator NikR [Gammaproteobacteria bacterium]